MQGTSHGTGMMLGNYANCASGGEFQSRGLGYMPTIDQVLAYSNKFYGSDPRARSVVLATGSPGSLSDTDYGMPGGPIENIPAYIEPLYLFQDLFGDFVEPDEEPTEHPNLSLVNSVHGDYAQLKNHQRLSRDDRAALERHMAFLADLESELAQGFTAGCSKPEEPPFYDMGYPWQEVSSVEDFERVVELLVDISVAAIRCDLTRVVTFQPQMGVTDAGGSKATSYHSSDDSPGDWHDFAHDAVEEPGDHDHINSLNRWVVEKIFARYVQGLDVEEAFGRTYLDNSLVYLSGELSMDHYVLGMPTLMAGSAGGKLETGRYVDYTQLDGSYANAGTMPWGVLIPGLPHNRLLVTILQAMGLSPNDYERDGIEGYGHHEHFGGPYNLDPGVYDISQIGQPLPGIWLG